MANFLLIFYIASACIDSYASEHNMMRNFKLFLMPALMAYLSFHANHDFLLYIALLLSWAGDVYLINKTKKNYQLGLISFMLAHISYLFYSPAAAYKFNVLGWCFTVWNCGLPLPEADSSCSTCFV